MRFSRLTLLQAAAVCLALASVPAAAFQEQKVAPAEPGAPAAQALPSVPLLQPSEGKTTLQLSAPDAGKGTEVRLPGLGKLGVLPKLDFGLDILYGATDDRRKGPGEQGNSDEVSVTGRIKHKF